jgi:hypothetical protein
MKCSLCGTKTNHFLIYQLIRDIKNGLIIKKEFSGFVLFSLCHDCIYKTYINHAPVNFWGISTQKKRKKEVKELIKNNVFFDMEDTWQIINDAINDLSVIPADWVILYPHNLNPHKLRYIYEKRPHIKFHFLNIVEEKDYNNALFNSIPEEEQAKIFASREIFIEKELYKQFNDEGDFLYDGDFFEQDEFFSTFKNQLLRIMLEKSVKTRSAGNPAERTND